MIRNAIVKCIVWNLSRRASPEKYLAMRRRAERDARRFIRLPVQCFRAPVDAGGVPAVWTSWEGADEGRTIFYLHGGAYSLLSPRTHAGLVSRVARACAARVLVPDYRLAPEHPHPAALEDAIGAYRWLLKTGVKPKRLAVMGDSAGGGLALALLQTLVKKKLPLPSCAVLMSPWTDLTCSGETMKTNRRRDPFLRPRLVRGFARLYAPEEELSRPTVSPLFGDFSGLPPLFIQVGSVETILDDSRRAKEKAAAAGTPAELEIWRGMIHVFQFLAPYLPEAREAIHRIGIFVARHVP